MSKLNSTMALDTASYWEDKIDTNVRAAFSVPPFSDQYLNPSSDVAF